MRVFLRELTSALLLGGLIAGCSSKPDIPSHIQNNGSPPSDLAVDEAIFLEVRGDRYQRRTAENNFSTANVFIELNPNRVIYSRKFSVEWNGGDSQTIAIETLDQSKLDEDEFHALRARLAAYRAPEGFDKGMVRVPEGCSVVLHSISPAIVSFGKSYFALGKPSSFVFPADCESSSGLIIKNDLQEILDRIPPLGGLERNSLD